MIAVGDDVVRLDAVRILGRGPVVDVSIEEGRVRDIRPSAASSREATRASVVPRIVLPGLVDLHTHLREPGDGRSETIESGARAAAAGGYTDVFAMANTSPVIDDVAGVEAVRRAAASAAVRVHQNAAATRGLDGAEPVDVAALRAAGVAMFSDDGRCVTDDAVVYDLMRRVARHGGVFAQHAQSAGIAGRGVVDAPIADQLGCTPWPGVGETSIVARDIEIARATGCALHVCHVSTHDTVELIRWAKASGAPVTAEVTPHHLALDHDDVIAAGPALKVNPPLRSARDVRALRAALREGVIDAVGTDHAPHPEETKRAPWPSAAFGLTALETALAVVAEVFDDGTAVDWAGVARVMSSAPAAIGGLTPRGPLVPGAVADLCVVEAGGPWRVVPAAHRSRSRNTPFADRTVQHRVVATVRGGVITHTA